MTTAIILLKSNIWPMPSTQLPRFTCFQTRLHSFGSFLCLWNFAVATIILTHRFWISRMSPPLYKQNLPWTGNRCILRWDLCFITFLSEHSLLPYMPFLILSHSGFQRTQIAKPSDGHRLDIHPISSCRIDVQSILIRGSLLYWKYLHVNMITNIVSRHRGLKWLIITGLFRNMVQF